MPSAPDISVLMCVYNGQQTVRAALDSCENGQNCQLELIVVDDGSTDATPEILEEFARHADRIKVIRKSNSGLTHSLNTGLAHASGRFIARLDADDLALPGRFEKQLQFLRTHADIALVGSNALMVDERGRNIGATTLGELDAAQCQQRLSAMDAFFPHSSWMVRRCVMTELRGYDEFFRKAQDYEFLLRLSEAHAIACMNERLITLRKSRASVTFDEDLTQYRYAVVGLLLHEVRQGRLCVASGVDKEALWECVQRWLLTSRLREKLLAQHAVSFAVSALRTRDYASLLRELARAAALDPLFLIRRPSLNHVRRNVVSLLATALSKPVSRMKASLH